MNPFNRGPHAHSRDPRVIDKRVLSEARASLKQLLKQYEDEPLQHQFGPPSCDSMCPRIIPQHQKDKFWEIMLKEGVVAKHPYGGYMHPRFAAVQHPDKEWVKLAVLKEATEIGTRQASGT